ncbi:MAG: hypothetical protein V1843_02815 [bacterium]
MFKYLASFLVITAIILPPVMANGSALELAVEYQITLKVKAIPIEGAEISGDVMNKTIEVMRKRIDAFGVFDPKVEKSGTNEILVKINGIKDPERAISIILDPAELQLVTAEWLPEDMSVQSVKEKYGADAKVTTVKKFKGFMVESDILIILIKPVLTGAAIKKAWTGTDAAGNPTIEIELTPEATETFKEVTGTNIGKPLAIVLDGEAISAPIVQEKISSGLAQITGYFGETEAKDLAIKLNSGALPALLEILEKNIEEEQPVL